jgi:NTE family protein
VKKAIILLGLLFCLSPVAATEKIGLALSGGGARGFAHIGMLKVIDEVGLPIDAISGTSIGAIIGGLYSMGYTAVEIESLFVNIDWNQLFDDKVSRSDLSVSQKRWAPYGNYSFIINKGLIPDLPSGFIPGERIDELLFSMFYQASSTTNFDDLPIPFRCVATNLVTGEEKIFSSGSMAEAIRASMSIPSIFHPFELDGQLYIDGGISQNLPAAVLSDMGVNHCVGLKVNSKLRSKRNLTDIIKVLDQTINIGITSKVNESIGVCGILIEPDLSPFNSTDFDKIKEIINAGEKSAREHIFQLQKLAAIRNAEPVIRNSLIPMADTIRFHRIDVSGNEYLSSSKITEYSGLYKNEYYTKEDIIRHVRDAYNFELFDTIYPIVIHENNQYTLSIKVKEKARKTAALNLTYNQDDKLTAGVVFSFTNLIQKNSKLLAEIKIGGKNALSVDYAKNFGKYWGGYFRLFPYIEENRLYFYNNEHEKTGSVRSLEYGSTVGVGIFAKKFIILEGYGFSYNTRLYREISSVEVSGKDFTSSGLGVKLYHESLDDYLFPMKGSQFLAKFSLAEKNIWSDATYKKFKTTFRLGVPLLKSVSVWYRFEYGSYFKEMDVIQFDPFYFGGLDSFIGYQRSEKSAPFYKINTATLRLEPIHDLFIDGVLGGLNYANSDIWTPFKNLTLGGGMIIGYKTIIGPLRFGVGFNEDSAMNYYLSLGFDYDIFQFSRR